MSNRGHTRLKEEWGISPIRSCLPRANPDTALASHLLCPWAARMPLVRSGVMLFWLALSLSLASLGAQKGPLGREWGREMNKGSKREGGGLQVFWCLKCNRSHGRPGDRARWDARRR